MTRVPVLVAGGGSVGLSLALFLARRGVRAVVAEAHDGPSIHPRATGIGPRTMEFFREAGIEDAVNAAAIDMSARGIGKLVATTLRDADLSDSAVAQGRLARAGMTQDEFTPSRLRGICAQHRLDAVLLAELRRLGADVRYGSKLTGLTQDADGVTATLAGGDHITADYLVGADGARSDVRETLGIGVTGPGPVGNAMINILFRADLTRYTRGVPFVNCSITTPDAPGLLVTVDGAQEWVFHAAYDQDGGERAADFTPPRCAGLIRTAVGDPDLDVEVRSVLPWRPRGTLADEFTRGRVFLAGDAAHTVPPIGGFGLNTGIADAHNLAWKLAAVLNGTAGPALLDSYAAERRPVAELTLDQAMRRLADPGLHWNFGPDAEAARVAAGLLHAPVVHLGYRYDSAAVLDAEPELPSTQDVMRNLDGAPGARLPHLWLERDGEWLSTLDLVAGEFAVLTPSPEWVRAAEHAGAELGVRIGGYLIGWGGLREGGLREPEGLWPEAVGVAGDGAVLVRPDGFVGWRAKTCTADPAGDLVAALRQILAR